MRLQPSGPVCRTDCVQAPRVQGEREAIFAFKALHRVGKPAGDERKPLTEWKAPGCLVSSKDGEDGQEETGRPQRQSWRGATCLPVCTDVSPHKHVRGPVLSLRGSHLEPRTSGQTLVQQWTAPGSGCVAPPSSCLPGPFCLPPGGASGSVFPGFQKSAPA